MTFTTRNAEHGDMDAMVGLLGELFSMEADFSVVQERQENGLRLMLEGCGKHRCIKVAETDGKVVAMCSAQLLVSTAEGAYSALVEDMVVTQSARGQGMGAALLEAVRDWAELRGVTRMQLLADKNNLPALAFYKKQGWTGTQLICLQKTGLS